MIWDAVFAPFTEFGFMRRALLGCIAISVGTMLLPAVTRFWATCIGGLALSAVVVALLSSLIGLLQSYHFSLPSGPAIILVAAITYVMSLVLGRRVALSRALCRVSST